MGFAQPWVAYPHNSAYALSSWPDRLKLRVKYQAVACLFATADVLMLLSMDAMAPRFRERLLRDDPTTRDARRTPWAA